METKGICPVVFIGDKIKTCKDINSLFPDQTDDDLSGVSLITDEEINTLFK